MLPICYNGFVRSARFFLLPAVALAEEGALPPMPARLPRASMAHAVLLTPPKSSHPRPLLSRQQPAPISPLAATLMDSPASVANKRLTSGLSPLNATLTKYRGDILRPKSFSLSSALRSLQFLSALQCLCGSSVFHLPY